MTESEREAVEWLRSMQQWKWSHAGYVQTIIAVLEQPRMPEEPGQRAVSVMLEAYLQHKGDVYQWAKVYSALREHLSKSQPPPMRSINVWHVEYLWSIDAGQTWQPAIELYTSEDAARRFAREQRPGASIYRDVSVTGPHERRVPV